MKDTQPLFEKLEARRRELGISQAVLAERSGVSLPTVHRILSGHGSRASIENILAVIQILGMELNVVPRLDSAAILEQQARRKAEKLVQMVQETSALEGQGVSAGQMGRMIRKTIQELLAGSRRRLWAE